MTKDFGKKFFRSIIITLIISLIRMTASSVSADSVEDGYRVVMNHIPADGETVNIVCYDRYDTILWSVVRGSYPYSEVDQFSELGITHGSYYYLEAGTLMAIDLYTGIVRVVYDWDYIGSVAERAHEKYYDGNIYFIEWDRGRIFVIGENDTVYGPFYDASQKYWHPYRLMVDREGIVTVVYEEDIYYQGDDYIQYDLTPYL